MGFVGLLKFSMKHTVLLAWPLCALGYPLCASVRAIETKSEAETQNLIAYWISFSAILLFEHAFEKLLEWLAFWCYVKLVIVVGLVINDFSGSFYVYNHLFQPCLSLNLQTLIDWFNEAKKSFSFSKKDTFLVELDKYVNANGTDALQNLLAAKGVNLSHASKEVRAVTFEQGKASAGPSVDMLHSEVLHNHSHIAESGLSLRKFEGHKATGKDIEDVQMTENKQMISTMLAVDNELMAVDNNVKSLSVDQKQVLSAEPILRMQLEIEEIESSPVPVELLEVEYSSKSSNSVTSPRSLQADEEETNFESEGIFVGGNGKTWYCTICKVYRRKKNSIDRHLSSKEHKRLVRELKGKGVELRDSLWWCTVCDISCGSRSNMEDHLNGKKHLAKLK